MNKLETLRFALSTGIHTMALLAFAVAMYLEASQRRSVANLWYVVFVGAFAAGLAYSEAHLASGATSAPFRVAGIDVRTALAAGIWPVALWALSDALNTYRRAARYAGYWAAVIVAAIQLKAHHADAPEVVFGYAVGALVSWQIVRMAAEEPRARGG